MKLSLLEGASRGFVANFLQNYISTGCLSLLEAEGTDLTFQGTDTKKCSLKVVLEIHNPQFYWKVMTRSDIGLAEAYIDGDFSFVDTDEGLVNFILLLIANKDSNAKKRGWWKALLFTAGIASIKLFYQHVLRQNTLTQARRNISSHYDVSNEVFALFLGETMNHSTGIFKVKLRNIGTIN
ncbi:tuberculostearic acid methyltransferase UfaA1-like [Jatropha curcas]|uniref:tuberculostearic acid methyltransferase UfaA1-like n=1 Tax=Jatropha curcas TaxID=180498 RepID=UPI0018931651|nr:tuberculostearic acid methyltransferase UfaA1-like [Jatropha curcas]